MVVEMTRIFEFVNTNCRRYGLDNRNQSQSMLDDVSIKITDRNYCHCANILNNLFGVVECKAFRTFIIMNDGPHLAPAFSKFKTSSPNISKQVTVADVRLIHQYRVIYLGQYYRSSDSNICLGSRYRLSTKLINTSCISAYGWPL